MSISNLRDTGITTPYGELLDNALWRLHGLREIDCELHINALQSSALLCLAGIRAESPYHNFSTIVSTEHVDKLNDRLDPLGLAIFSEDLLPFADLADRTTTFSFINTEVLRALPQRYKVLGNGYPVCANPGDALLMFAYASTQQFRLSKMMERRVLPRRWLRWWLAAHDIRFGMQLGYPGTAISAYVSAMASATHGDDLVEVVIDDSMAFNGTQVMFGCAQDQTGDDDVRQAVDLMSRLITDVRDGHSEQQVLADRSVAAAHRRLLAAENRSAVSQCAAA